MLNLPLTFSAGWKRCEKRITSGHKRRVVIAASQAAKALDFVLKNEMAEPQGVEM